MLVGIIYLWRTGVAREDRAASPSSDTDTFGPSATDGLQFFPASNPKIHYVGRWMAAPNRMRMDGTFPGVYLDISVNITSTVLLALSNAAAAPATLLAPAVSSSAMDKVVTPNVGHLSFRPSSLYQPPAPISLLARVDQEEYILLPNATSLIAIRLNDLDPNNPHEIRVIAPMAGTLGDSILAVKGIWLDQGGQLLRLPGSPLPAEFDDEDALHAGSQGIREEHLRGLDRLKQDDRPSRPDGEVDEATLGDAAFERTIRQKEEVPVVEDVFSEGS
ncbi:MAG: hypothetical protein M1838_000481 [Thelocarpon superellum]|nr:MAG: hypothetical protein M1838_000481 [Thelocarpon superellum]